MVKISPYVVCDVQPPVELEPGQTIRPGQLLKRRTDLDTGRVTLVPYDGIGQAEGYVNERGMVLPYQNYETCSIPRAMVTYPHLFQRDSIAGALYRRDLLAGLDDHVVYMRNLDFTVAQDAVEAYARFARWLTI